MARVRVINFSLATIFLLASLEFTNSSFDIFPKKENDIVNPTSLIIFEDLFFRDPSKERTTYDIPLINAVFDWIGPKDERKNHIKHLLSNEVADIGTHTEALLTIERAGYSYELYNVTSKDGYLTQLIRIIDKSLRKEDRHYPPVAIYGGQSLSPSLFALASLALEHHNRSIAFELAQNGFDVWMIPARGVDPGNHDWFMDSREKLVTENKTLVDQIKRFTWHVEKHSYWSFSQDEIIEYEFQGQLDLILRVTKCETLSLITYSNGGLISFGFLASHPEYVKKIDSLISISPAIFVNKFNPLLRMSAVYGQFRPAGEALIDEFWDSAARHRWISLCKNKAIRYTACKFFLDSFYGSSTTFNTFIELNMLEHISRPQPVRGLVQLMQIADWGKFRRFSHGLWGNTLIYGTPIAPEYKLEQVKHERLFIFSGMNDQVADLSGIELLTNQLGRKPIKHYKIPGYNHLDMIAAWDVDKAVVSPIASILIERDFELINKHPVAG